MGAFYTCPVCEGHYFDGHDCPDCGFDADCYDINSD